MCRFSVILATAVQKDTQCLETWCFLQFPHPSLHAESYQAHDADKK